MSCVSGLRWAALPVAVFATASHTRGRCGVNDFTAKAFNDRDGGFTTHEKTANQERVPIPHLARLFSSRRQGKRYGYGQRDPKNNTAMRLCHAHALDLLAAHALRLTSCDAWRQPAISQSWLVRKCPM